MLRPPFLFPVILPVLFLFTCVVDTNAKPRWVNLKKELDSANIVMPVKIVAYGPDLLKFQPAGSMAILSAKYSTDPAWNPSQIYMAWPPQAEKMDMTAGWPPVGADVLVVVDKDNIVSLFAWPYGDSYRFWSPEMTESIAAFNCTALGATIRPMSQEQPDSGWDGCWVQKSKISEKGLP